MKTVLSSSSLHGSDVKNLAGENLGNIKDLMIDTHSGNIRYAVLSFGGFLGLGDKYFAMPWEAFSFDSDGECLQLNIVKDKLEDAPGFDKDDWPSHADHAYLTKVYSHYGYQPYWEAVR